MRYIMRNKKYGLKVVAPSEASRDNILKHSKEENGQKVWEQFSVLPDDVVPKHEELSIEELKAMLAAAEERIARMTKAEADKVGVELPKKRGPKPKVKKDEKSTEKSHGLTEEANQEKEDQAEG